MKEFFWLLRLFRNYWAWALAGVLISLISLLANITLLSISGWFITTMGLAGVTGAAVNYFTPAAIIRTCAILRTCGRYAERLVMHEATFRFMAEMRQKIYEQIEAIPLAKTLQYHSGDLLTRLRNDIDTLETFYINIVLPVCVAFISIVVLLWVTAGYSPVIALSQFVLLIFSGLVVPYIAYLTGRKPAAGIVQDKSVLKEVMVDNLQAYAEMSVYGIINPRMNNARQLSDRIIDTQRRMGVMEGFSQALNGFIANSAMWIVLIVAIPLLRQNQIAPAQLPMLALLALASFEAVSPLSGAFQSLEACIQAARRLVELHEKPVRNSSLIIAKNQEFDLHMKNVCFAYGSHAPVLNNFSMRLKSGVFSSLVGPSGIGKSSVFHLLTGFYTPQKGQIELNGLSIDLLDEAQLRSFFAVVPQNPYVFSGTLRSNLLLANPQASQQELDHACKIACLDQFISELSQGYDTYIGEGGITLSGGERRRLAVARAVLKNSPCLLLDEPTESLDHLTANTIMQRLKDYASDRAVLMITHDLALAQSISTSEASIIRL